jgi:hypothetical protein
MVKSNRNQAGSKDSEVRTMNANYTTRRGAHPTPAEIEAYISAARRLRAETMAQMAGALAGRIKSGLQGLRPALRPAASPCHSG